MGKRCEKCVGQKFCSCPKNRPKDKPPEKWKSPRRERVLTHNWTPWQRSVPEGIYLVKMCWRCGRTRRRLT